MGVYTTADGHWIGKFEAKRAWYVGNCSKVDTNVSRPMPVGRSESTFYSSFINRFDAKTVKPLNGQVSRQSH